MVLLTQCWLQLRTQWAFEYNPCSSLLITHVSWANCPTSKIAVCFRRSHNTNTMSTNATPEFKHFSSDMKELNPDWNPQSNDEMMAAVKKTGQLQKARAKAIVAKECDTYAQLWEECAKNVWVPILSCGEQLHDRWNCMRTKTVSRILRIFLTKQTSHVLYLYWLSVFFWFFCIFLLQDEVEKEELAWTRRQMSLYFKKPQM